MDEKILGVVDLGSNSFHLAIVQEDNGRLVVIDRMKSMVQLAYGLTPEKLIHPNTREKALTCLAQFGERLAEIDRKNIRVVGTNTLRQLKDPSFMREAEAALGVPIEIISGKEEARLIYLGVIQYVDLHDQLALVIDIGGGSTELVLGDKDKLLRSSSLEVGCVRLAKQFFFDDKISKKQVHAAALYLETELQPLHPHLTSDPCQYFGASGTIRTLREMIEQENLGEEEITATALKKLLKILLSLGTVRAIERRFDLTTERARVICSGLLILKAVMEKFNLEVVQPVDTALREGMVLDLLGRIHKEDMRDLTIESLVHRFGANIEQAKRVEATSLYMVDKIELSAPYLTSPRRYLGWASLLHEIGLAISYHRHYKHSAYLVEHADLDGFSRTDQKILAAILYNHKRRFNPDDFEYLPDFTIPLTLILRISVLLHRSREPQPMPEFDFQYAKKKITLTFPPHWLDEHPLIQQDLQLERDWLKEAGIKIEWE
ncbi:exopolyphosphatase [Wohlfahrtiimonas chitiniclastica]|uniref:Exopolyphosphatase n=1 Tax=Wohlfahrtiimonas chitiniclastica SH04 TaxID=1261130 RepID=L8XXD8_9GAMM|nr:Ppx/GppA phosphatase family protein [Wohlfahrtiimonas chitiniclastica]ELV07469.1 Exopolyphosphatase [Wohlfahrtiimonas chitiniclastica SH04]KZX37174.1 exopolyphosphatase [Wohlfahrtiimonas chitiniclastica]MBS7815217.1 Ppx/GppA family phosphatase [Wohlfahrtiimonas chitiniclastica]MBS7826911.1 Ppx/GppA family phosphatase [Wohlfahrtiimonas chitiniclastica]MBS7838600.1 Ppx/GppA family phosphatase [Wohlfahrtiimonas chitiniclastica]